MLYGFWDYWLLYHKVTFDGPRKRIKVNEGVDALSVKNDIYSSWKEWVMLDQNAKFLPAFRTIGGDPVGGGQYAGDMYFLTNGWQIEVDHTVKVSGIVYHDDGLDPFVILEGGGVTATVSNLAYSYSTSGVSAADVANAVWNHSTALDMNSKIAIVSKILRNKTITNPSTGVMTVFDDDGTTILFQANVFENVSGAQPYRGQGADRRDRLA